jgi:methionine aminotransferase
MTRTITSKLPDVGTTIFTVMSQLAAETGALNLSQGFPGFDPPEALVDRIDWHIRNGANQYAPMPGVPALRQVIADKTYRFQRRRLDTEREITVCTGATEGLFSAVTAIVRPGDEVVILDPAYDSYEPAVRLAGGVTRRVPLQIDPNGHDFRPDWQRIADTINARTRLLVLNFPHNPTGATLSMDDLDALADILRDTDCLIVSDEVYEHIVFDGEPHRSLLSHDELWERSFIISSFGKTVHATGWKVGYCIAPATLTEEFRRVHQFTTFSVSTPMQFGLADFLAENPAWCSDLPAFYELKRDRFCSLLEGSRFSLQPTRSTFFQLLDYADISGAADLDLARRWTRDIGIASIPLSVFCETPFTGTRLRFCFAKDDATLEEAARRLCAVG